MNATTRDRLGSLIALLFVAALAVQRNYMTPFDGVFPDTVLVILTLVVVLTLILSFTSKPAVEGGVTEESKAAPRSWVNMVVVGAILLAWALLLRTFGFALTGIVAFTLIAWYLAGMPKDVKLIGRSLVVAAVVAGILIFVFGSMLRVPLPQGTIFG